MAVERQGSTLFPGMERTAHFSEDGVYRYDLVIPLAETGLRVVWVLCNPSTADEHADDRTIARVRTFTTRFGGGTCIILNRYAFRSPYPKVMKAAENEGIDIKGPENDLYFAQHLAEADLVVGGWGGIYRTVETDGSDPTSPAVNPQGKKIFALAVTAAGDPGHPLYLPTESQLLPWSP